MASPKVSILVLAWNSGELVLEALRSSLNQTHENVEVILLDNASSDGTARLAYREFGDAVTIFRFDTNWGYTGGYNRGVELATGDFLLFLNPDARLEPDFIERALPHFEDERVGILSGLLVREDGQTIDSAGQFLARSRATIDRGFGRSNGDLTGGPVLSACGAAAMYRREMIDDVADAGAFLDADYFAYHEDLEIGWRAWRAGWSAVFDPGCVATHLRSGGDRASGGMARLRSRSPEINAHIVKNRWLSNVRHDSLPAAFLDSPWIAARELGTLLALLVASPGTYRRLWSHRPAFRRALARRKTDRTRSGRWGRWKRGVPKRGIWT